MNKVLSDEHLGAKLRVTENRCVLFDSFTYIYLALLPQHRALYAKVDSTPTFIYGYIYIYIYGYIYIYIYIFFFLLICIIFFIVSLFVMFRFLVCIFLLMFSIVGFWMLLNKW